MTTPLFHSSNASMLDAIITAMGGAFFSVHIDGEAGVGKEMIVRTLYARCPHNGSPFIKVNCPALTVGRGEDGADCISEIASHANMSRYHLFRLFQQGVLYLEAVDRLDAPLQHKLCDLIRRKSGAAGDSAGKTPRKIAVFSTSTRPLHGCMADGSVLPELGGLLDTVSVHIPPLRRSPERIGPLVDYFLRKGAAPGCQQILFPPTALQLASLQAYPWPGNVKELHALVCTARRLADWDAAIGRLQNGTAAPPPHGPVDWSTDGIALMPDFEIRSRRMLDELTTSLQSDEMGLMDLVFYEEVLAGPKRS